MSVIKSSECGKEVKCKDKCNKIKNKTKTIIIIILLIVIITIGIIILIMNNNTNNTIKYVNKKIEESQNALYEEYGSKENYDKEKILQQVSKEYEGQDIKVYDIQLKENSNDVTAKLLYSLTKKYVYMWEQYTGISEKNYNEIPEKTKVEITSAYGPAYRENDVAVYWIESSINGKSKEYSSLEDIIISEKWEGFKYNWEKM